MRELLSQFPVAAGHNDLPRAALAARRGPSGATIEQLDGAHVPWRGSR